MRHRKLKSRLTGCDEWTEFETEGETLSMLGGFGTFDRVTNVCEMK